MVGSGFGIMSRPASLAAPDCYDSNSEPCLMSRRTVTPLTLLWDAMSDWRLTFVMSLALSCSLAYSLPRVTQARPSSLAMVVQLVFSTLGRQKETVSMSLLPCLASPRTYQKLTTFMPTCGTRPSKRLPILYNVK